MISIEKLQEGIILPIDKPRQWTSFQVVNKVKSIVRHLVGIKNIKIGHAGTLDPLATGLLLVCIGKATKNIPLLQDGEKVYTGTMVFGATTPSFDLEQPIDSYYPYEHITNTLLNMTTKRFLGSIQQVPPLFSAVKINGQRAYLHARTGDLAPSIESKTVNVYSFEISAFRPPFTHTVETIDAPNTITQYKHHLYQTPLGTVPAHLPQADFRIRCGKGTYIRSLARDLGVALGSGAYLSALRREMAGSFTIEHSIQLDQVEVYLNNL